MYGRGEDVTFSYFFSCHYLCGFHHSSFVTSSITMIRSIGVLRALHKSMGHVHNSQQRLFPFQPRQSTRFFYTDDLPSIPPPPTPEDALVASRKALHEKMEVMRQNRRWNILNTALGGGMSAFFAKFCLPFVTFSDHPVLFSSCQLTFLVTTAGCCYHLYAWGAATMWLEVTEARSKTMVETEENERVE
jgi:hypothetical protein